VCRYRGCRVPSESGSDLCIFHAELPKDVEEFKSALYRQLDELGPASSRNRRFSFVGYRFPVGITIGEAFERVSFNAVVLPSAMTTCSFRNARVSGFVRFHKAIISGNADFTRTEIQRYASFAQTTIRGDAIFTGVSVNGFLSFSDATVEGHASFGDAMITGDVCFVNAAIQGDATFGDATIEGGGFYAGVTFKRNTDFQGMAIHREVGFQGCSASSTSLGTDAPKLRGWSLGKERCGIELHHHQTAASFWHFAERTYARNGERWQADVAFYMGRVWRWKALRRSAARAGGSFRGGRTLLLRAWYSVLWAFDLLLLRWTTAYGASLSRLFTSWLVVIGGFGITFSMAPRLIESAGEQVWTLRNWIVGFHYSVTTFATLGLGRIGPGPSRLGMVLTSIEALLGAILIALAVLVIGRRFMRQG